MYSTYIDDRTSAVEGNSPWLSFRARFCTVGVGAVLRIPTVASVSIRLCPNHGSRRLLGWLSVNGGI
jgi:hypothetical protein